MPSEPKPTKPQRLRVYQLEIDRLNARISELEKSVTELRELAYRGRAALHTAIAWAEMTDANWDADLDAKVGKMLKALSGRLKRYAPDTDIIHDTMKKFDDFADADKLNVVDGIADALKVSEEK